MEKARYWNSVKRSAFFAGITAALLLGIGCKPKQKIYHVGILSGLDAFYEITDGFKDKMTELGYREGKNIFYEVHRTTIDFGAYKKVLNKFVADKVDLILTFPTEASIEAKSITKGTGIPVVFANAFTENTGLVNNIREPGGTMTGVRWVGPDIALQRLEILHELAPNAKRIWVPYLKDYPIVKGQLGPLRAACVAAGLDLTEIPAIDAADLEAQLQKKILRSNSHPDALLQISEPFAIMPDAFQVLCTFAKANKIPVGGVYLSIDGCESLFGLIPQNIPQGKQAAFLADKILKGALPGSIPVVSAECSLQISFRAATELGLSISEGLLSKADKVIR
jgi:putative tryptophan/tyrosine transport system substrate-binding protein